ncbi:MAG: hypothetical protein IKS19_07280 [Clostridia bacterium]|nr:hypothetical protein [Clostridia bacterium]
MNKFSKIAASALTVCLIFLSTLPCLAENYSYTVNMSGGLHGRVTGRISDTFDYNEQWNPNDYPVEVTNEKYYFKGYHISGREGIVGATKITKDTVFVATYGIRGSTVTYKVNYCDQSGNPLRESMTYTGNEGDKPVIAFLYVEDYLPQAYNLTKTLSSDESENVFTFTYRKIPAQTTSGSKSSGGTSSSNIRVSNSGPKTSGSISAANVREGTLYSDQANRPDSTDNGENQSSVFEPAEILDLDDGNASVDQGEKTAGQSAADSSEGESTGIGLWIGIAAGIVVLLGAVILYRLIYRKRKQIG